MPADPPPAVLNPDGPNPDVLDPELAALADRLNQAGQRFDPFEAGAMGLTEYDGLVPDASPAAAQAFRAESNELAATAAGMRLSAPIDLDVQAVIAATTRTRLLALDLAAVEHTVTAQPIGGPPVLVLLAAQAVLTSPQRADDFLDRLRAAPGWIDQVSDRLRAGAARGRVPVASLCAAAMDWADDLLGSELPAAFDKPYPADESDAQPATSQAWGTEVRRLARDEMAPAVRRWRDLLAQELLPVARPDDRVGVGWLPDGEADYARAIEIHTTLPLTAQELHETGLAAVDELEERARRLGAGLGLSDLAAVHAAFRAGGQDPAVAIEAARAAVRRAESRVAEVIPPPLPDPCAVSEMPATAALAGMAPHYTLPRTDGSRPGTYWFNTLTPTAGTGWDLEAVTYHETVPGHHLQLARDQVAELPALLSQTLVTVHAEGWGLYCEQLSDEMGLYSSVEQQIGAVFMQLHRAARLVVDSGMHAFGWSRARAREYLVVHLPIPAGFLAAEVDRYIAWPGQALAYMTGQREILRLRAHARDVLGDRFDLSGFHGAVLGRGSLPLPVLRTVVGRWEESRRA